ncbi:PREDICTED: DET1 homolog [Nicrophorus vespilloides]|uniref:DET1 homolog n=1 Tax=Nicrophorus vespilloides TaxID=110193 RepID=A0ABM1NGY8_NICVS|nr:PREDICTED: DET1 homolog [Nicrophorus vespilloides]
MDLFAKPPKVPPQNIVIRLINRETFGSKRPGTHYHVARQFYQNVFPNFTVINIEKPPCFLRKFSPCGKYFIAFSSDQTSLEIYVYRGSSAAGDLLQNISQQNDKQHFEIKSKIFERFFKLKYTVNVAPSSEQLNRECSLFSEDGRYVIIGSACYIPENLRPHFYEIYTNNESVTPNPKAPLEDYTLHLIDLKLGKLCDTRNFKVDKIFMSHNQGLYLYKDILAVLSVQHQVIHIFQILDGMFVDVRKIGRFCYEDDAYYFSSVFPNERAFRENLMNSLKHRMMTFLFRRAYSISQRTNDPYEIRKFYQYFENFKSLRIWKMQLLDENHILLKYASEDVVTLKSNDASSQPSFYVVYNMVESKVLAIYENISKELLDLLENFCDNFRNAHVYNDSRFSCSTANNIYARLLHHRFKQTIISAKYGGKTEAIKRILGQLPISAQSYSSSPYLDLSLFSYDDKWVSIMERPKPCGEHPIRFYARDSGFLKFRIFAGNTTRAIPAARRLVAFTFHPTDPFAISVQRTNAEYIVNFHIRYDNCNASASDDNENVLNFL